MILREYIENSDTSLELIQNNFILAKGGLRDSDNTYKFYGIDYENLLLLEPQFDNDKKIEFEFYESITIKDFEFGISSFKLNNNLLKITFCFFTDVNHFRTSIDLKRLLKRFEEYEYKEMKFIEGSVEDEFTGDRIYVWEASFSFQESIQFYIDKVKSEFDHIIDIELINNTIDWKNEYEKNELRFTQDILIPLFNLMGYHSVRFNHGTKEFGKDITFYDIDKFGNIEHYGVQVKAGNISGRNNSDLNEILSQILDSFNIPFIDIDSGQEQYLSKVIIAISGEFTENAKTKIMHHIPPTLKNNIRFLDKAKTTTLITKIINNNT